MSSLTEIENSLLAPGGPFELARELVLGNEMAVFARRLPSLRVMVENSRGHGDAEYCICEETRLTFAQHLSAVASFARVLRDAYGVRKGARVAILAENAPEWIIAFWAAVSLGAIVVGMNGWWVRDEILFALDDSDPTVLVADEKRLARLHTDDLRVPVVSIEREAGLFAPAADDTLPDELIEEDDPACILYTSGTTGRPKGAVASHRSIVALTTLQFFHGFRVMMSHPPSAAPSLPPCQLVTNPLFHVSGLYSGAIAMLAGGVKTVLTKGKFDPDRILRLIEVERVTSWSPMGTMAYRVVTSPNLARHDLTSVRSIGSGGAPMRPDLQERIRRAFPHAASSLGLGYGLTEGGALATINFGEELERRPGSVGRPMPSVEVEIRDAEDRSLPDGEEGEIHIRSPLLMLGYWRRAAETDAAFAPGRWLRTGDVGRLEDGYLYINSRKRDLILRGGENVYPTEIELRLEAHPQVAEAAVLGIADAELGQTVMAIVVPRDGARPLIEDLRAWVGETLAYYKVPARWQVRRDSLPRNATGKVMKHLLLGDVDNPFDAT